MSTDTYTVVRHANCGRAIRFERKAVPGVTRLVVVVTCPVHGELSHPEDFDPPDLHGGFGTAAYDAYVAAQTDPRR
jgi:hypothetical protein